MEKGELLYLVRLKKAVYRYIDESNLFLLIILSFVINIFEWNLTNSIGLYKSKQLNRKEHIVYNIKYFSENWFLYFHPIISIFIISPNFNWKYIIESPVLIFCSVCTQMSVHYIFSPF